MTSYHQPVHTPQGVYPGQGAAPSPLSQSPMTPGPGALDPIRSDANAYGAHAPVAAYGAASYVPMQQAQPSPGFLGLNFRDQQFWKGAILGAAVTFLLTNDAVQKSIIKGTAKLYGMVQGGVQEIKEKFEDVQAEMRHEADSK